MAVSFKNTKGKAQSNKVETYEYKDGENVLRLVGGILPRYVYWVKGSNNKDIPIECLSFDRSQEKFNNLEVDHVQKFFPDVKCGWSYVANCIDIKNSKVVAINLKKKMFESIVQAAEDLGDPTDPDTGWDIVFKRVKTGPLAFNVDYQLQVLRCKPRPLTEEERAMVASAKVNDEKYPRPTSDEVLALLNKITAPAEDEESGSPAENEAVNELGN
jgi:hypothetical protein